MNLNDRNDLRALRAQIEAALNGIDPSLTFNLGRMTFDRAGNFANFKVEVVAGQSQAELDLADACVKYRLQACEHGYVPGIGRCWLKSFNRRARKYPFIVECDGKQYKIGADLAVLGFGIKNQEEETA